VLPGEGELEVLPAMADHAALAIQGAQEAASAARHRAALEQLLAVSSSLTETFSIDTILQSICDGISTALGFRHACVDLPDQEGNLRTRAAHGWDMTDPAVGGSLTPDDVRSLLDPRYEIEGCYLLTAEQAAERIPPVHHVYHSELCGRGQNAWRDHWLVVPMWSRVGGLLLAAIRTIDDAFRIGGDEFALLLPETSAEDARTVIERVARELEQDPATDGLTAGFGVAVCPADGRDPERLFRAADAAMYHAKGQPPEARLPRAG